MREQYVPIEEQLTSELPAASTVRVRIPRTFGQTLTSLETGIADVAEMDQFSAGIGIVTGRARPILQRYGYGSWTTTSVVVTR